MTKEDMKNKYSAFITEISEIVGLGKPVDILKLCTITDLFFQPLEKRITELETQIEKMKCCANCMYEPPFDKHCDKCIQGVINLRYRNWKLREYKE